MKLLDILQIETGASHETLESIIRTAPRRYKVYEIDKKTGGKRIIAHPARELKAIQRALLTSVLNEIGVSDIAMAYVKGRGIHNNARAHVGQRWLLKLDFKDFFHSIVPTDWDRVVRRSPKLRTLQADKDLLHKILFWGAGGKQPYCLSIGAPTSPSVSNLVCLKLDEWMQERASGRNLIVTRYADDITVSGANVPQLERFEKDLRSALERNVGVKLKFNDNKRGLYGPGERKMVTGLILTPVGEVSIGRERKRELSSLVHRFATGSASVEQVFRGKGLLAFANSAEPRFYVAMREKYGSAVIDELQRAESPLDYLLIGTDL